MIDLKIGEARLRAIVELEKIEHTGVFVPGLNREDVERYAEELVPGHFNLETMRANLSHHAWLIEVNGKRIVVDPCVGHQRHYPLLPHFHMLDSKFLQRLEEFDAPPESIDYVFCTHMHFDHVGWNTRTVDGKLVPTFPNARYLFPRAEDEYWKYDLVAAEPRSPYNEGAYRECVQPIVEAGLAEMVDEGRRIADCLTLIDTPGHTIGHMAGVLESGGQGGVLCGDAIHHPTQVIFANHPAFGHDVEQLIASRRKILDICADRDFWLLSAHFCAPHVCKVGRRDDTYRIFWPNGGQHDLQTDVPQSGKAVL